MFDFARARFPAAKRIFAVVFLAYLGYSGYVRCTAIMHADKCVAAGGRYDEAADICRH